MIGLGVVATVGLGVCARIAIDSKGIERARNRSLFIAGASERGKVVERQAYITNPLEQAKQERRDSGGSMYVAFLWYSLGINHFA